MADEKEISNAFGNVEEPKGENKPVDQAGEQDKGQVPGEDKNKEVKETPADKPNPDSSKIEGAEAKGENKDGKSKMYTQEQVDAMMARARKKYTKGSNEQVPVESETVPTEDKPVDEQEPTDEEVQEEPRDLSTGITVDKLARAELKAQMAIDGVNPSKLVYACRMIDIADVVDESGNYSEEMAKTAIEEMLKVMPELKATQQQEANTFSFGAPEQQEQNPLQEEKNKISEIFGN